MRLFMSPAEGCFHKHLADTEIDVSGLSLRACCGRLGRVPRDHWRERNEPLMPLAVFLVTLLESNISVAELFSESHRLVPPKF